MFAMMVKFRNDNGEEQVGELVNSFRIMIEGTRQVVVINREDPDAISVLTFDGETLETHLVPTLALIKMEEVAIS